MRLELAAATALLAAVLVYGYRRETTRQRNWQQALLNCPCVPAEACDKRIEPDGYPALVGTVSGYPFEVKLARDDVTVRKVPCLWLCVSVRARLPSCPTLDILARMRGTEFYSPLTSLPHRIEPLPGWPQELTLKCSSPQGPLLALSTWVPEYFSDPCAKELLVTPGGVRLVHQFAQARRPEYLVLRASHFDTGPVPSELLQELLSRALTVIRTLSTHDSQSESAQASA